MKNKIMKNVLGAACLGLWAQAAVTGVLADSLVPPGVPEPGLIIWGTVVSALDNSSPVTINSASWDVTDGNKHVILSGESYVRIVDKNTYVLQVPFDTRTFNNATLEAPENSFELKSASPNYTLTPTINGEAAKIVKVEGSPSSGESYRTSLTAAERGKVIRLDLAVEIDPYWEWIKGYYPNTTDLSIIGKDADPDGDGYTNEEEHEAGTDPTDGDSYPKKYHSADQDKDGIISLKELTRVIQFYNSKNEGGYHTEDGTEDGFAPGGGVITKYHDSDYDPRNGIIELKELTRLIQFYNSKNEGGYHAEAGTEDGFAPGSGANTKGTVSLASDAEDSLEDDSFESAREFSFVQYPDGLKLQVDVYINGQEDIRSLSLQEQLPDGWSFVELVEGNPAGYPEEGDEGLLEFYWIKMPKLPCRISYVLDTPVKVKGLQSLNGKVQWRTSGEEKDCEIANEILIEEGMINYIPLADGSLGLFFNGKLYESEDLIQWDLIKDAINPYAVEVKEGKRFYRSREE